MTPPAHQLYYGPLYARSYADRNLAHLTSSNPDTVTTMKKRYGRYLSGFGSEDMSGSTGYDPAYQGQHLYDLEKEDDTFGSGIFDPGGRGGTDNANMGIFAGHYSLPGFVARDVPFRVMKDVTDITDGAQVVSIPGGGMLYVADERRRQGAAPSPPTWRPAIQPPGYTRYDQVYVDMQGKPVPMDGFGQLARQPRRVPHPVYGVPSDRYDPRRVPEVPSERSVGYTSIVHGGQLPVGINRARHPVSPAAPDMPMEPQVPFINTMNTDVQSIPLSGYGHGPGGVFGQEGDDYMEPQACPGQQQWDASVNACMCPTGTQSTDVVGECIPTDEKPGASVLQLALAGLLVGAGVGLVVSVAGKGRR